MRSWPPPSAEGLVALLAQAENAINRGNNEAARRSSNHIHRPVGTGDGAEEVANVSLSDKEVISRDCKSYTQPPAKLACTSGQNSELHARF